MAAFALGLVLLGLTAAEARGSPGWRWPVEGRVITSFSNDRANPYAGGMHRGIDVAAPVGATVAAAHEGDVTYAGALGYSGLTVAVRTTNGYVTSYLHLSAVSVRRGEHVEGGGVVGEVGTTGRRSTPAPHLHFGVRIAAEERGYVDPLSLLPPVAGAGKGAAPARAPAIVPVAPQEAPVAVARRGVRVPEAPPAGAPAVAAKPGLDWGRALALGGLGLLVVALVGGGAWRAARAANGAVTEQAAAVMRRALRAPRAYLPRWR